MISIEALINNIIIHINQDHKPKEMLPLWGTKLSINADKTDLQYSFILKTTSTNKNKVGTDIIYYGLCHLLKISYYSFG